MKDLVSRIQCTGGYITECNEERMFRHLIITPEEYKHYFSNNLPKEEMKEFIKENKVTFISVRKNNKINFLHVSSVMNEQYITNNGITPKDNDWILDLGTGIYVIEKENEEALENIQFYISEANNEESILLYEGEYDGEYLECVYGDGHIGYIVCLTSMLEPEDLDEVYIEDWLYS